MKSDGIQLSSPLEGALHTKPILRNKSDACTKTARENLKAPNADLHFSGTCRRKFF